MCRTCTCSSLPVDVSVVEYICAFVNAVMTKNQNVSDNVISS